LLLVFLQKDLGTAIILLIIMFFTFFAIPIKKEYKSKIYKLMSYLSTAIALVAIIGYFSKWTILTESQTQRLTFTDPCSRYEEAGSGYQVCNGYIAINSSSFFGKGIGNSTQKYLYLPEAHTDYIFPIIVEELGLIVGIFIIILYMYLLYRILLITKASNSLLSGIIGYGITIYIFSHIFINLAGILGLIPITGVPLPFLSYGGSFTLNLLISIGLIQRIAIENNISKKEEAIRNKIREQ
jgi:cell division protein FtsW